MGRRPQRETQAASVASCAICSDRRARISPRWPTTRRGSSHPRRRPSLRVPSRNIPRWQRRPRIRPNSVRSRRILKPQLRCQSDHRSDRRAPSRRARPRARRLPCLVARRRPFLPEASTIASALGVSTSRSAASLLSPAQVRHTEQHLGRWVVYAIHVVAIIFASPWQVHPRASSEYFPEG
jgi:hypothetical protein